MKSKKIIVARYNEPIEWVNELKCDYFVYNKGPEISPDLIDPSRVENVPNVGLESETYLRYIINNYNNLPDLVGFLQGHPFDHCPNAIELVNSVHDTDIVFPLSGEFWCDKQGNEGYYGLPIVKVQKEIMPDLDLERFDFIANAQFILPKELILNKPLDWWIWLYKYHDDYINSNISSGYSHIKPGYFIVHCFERLWRYIFNYEIKK
jgi:hypothetical protein